MNLDRRFRRSERIAGRSIAGESFLIQVCGEPADLENIFVMNPLADFIWQRLDEKHTLDMIVTEIVENFAVERAKASADASVLVDRLLANHLIEEIA